MPASPVCRCRFAASAASRTKDLCAASAAVAVHHHAWQCRRRSFVRAEGASSASPVASRAWRCSAERLLSTEGARTLALTRARRAQCGLRRAARTRRSRATSQARAVEVSASVLGVESILDGQTTGGTCAGATALRFALTGKNEYDGLRSFLQSTTLHRDSGVFWPRGP